MRNEEHALREYIKTLTNGAVEYTSGSWKYLMFGNLFVGWYTDTETLTIGTQVGNVYQTANSSTIALPTTLNNILYADVVVAKDSYSVWSAVYTCTSSTLYYRALSALSRASADYNVRAFVVGTIV